MTYWKLERPSKRSGKKWQVRVPTSSGRGKTVAFGDAKMSDYTLHKDKARRDNYRTRHQHDRIDDPYAPGFWSWWSLWGESSNLKKAHAAAVKRAKQILGMTTNEEGEEVVTRESRRNPNPPGTPSPTMAEVAEVVAVLDVPKHLRAEFMQGFATEWEHAHTVDYDLVMVGSIVLDHLAEDEHYYRKLRRLAGHRENPHAETSPSNRVQACFDALLSLVQEQYPSLACTIEVDEAAGERGGHACTRAYAFCEDLDDGSFRIAVAHKMNDAGDSRVEGLLRHELAHAVLLHTGDLEHTERDADEVAEALFGSPLYYDEDDVQTTDQSAPGARRPRPAYLDDEQGRTLDTAEPAPYDRHGTASRNPAMHQLETIDDVASCLDDCAAQGDAKTPRMLASKFSQQSKEVAGAQARMLTTLAKAARHCANAIEARLAGEVDRAMTSERMCDAALQEAAAPRSRRNPEDSYELIMDGLVPTTPAEKARLRRGARKHDLDVYHVGGWEWAFTGSKDNLQKYLSSMIDNAEEVEGHLRRARAVGSRKNPSGDAYELIMGGLAADSRSEKASLRVAARKCALEVHPVGYHEWAFTGSKADLRKYLSSMIDDAEEVEGHLRRAVAVRGNPEWAKKLGSGLYKGARYSAETARDLYVGAREAHRARSAPPVEGERKNPRRAHHPRGHSRGHKG